jgi:hypothetical protein
LFYNENDSELHRRLKSALVKCDGPREEDFAKFRAALSKASKKRRFSKWAKLNVLLSSLLLAAVMVLIAVVETVGSVSTSPTLADVKNADAVLNKLISAEHDKNASEIATYSSQLEQILSKMNAGEKKQIGSKAIIVLEDADQILVQISPSNSVSSIPLTGSGNSIQNTSPGNSGSAPGHTTNPGNSGSAPGHTTNPGNSGSAPGHTTNPGNSGSSPGQTSSPGNSGSAPGQTGNPGNSGSAPGQTSNPGNSGSSPGQTSSPGNSGSAPGQTGNPGNSGSAPGQTGNPKSKS